MEEPGILGQTIAQYRILSLLGEGGLGSVYKAEDPILGRVVAIKVLHRSLTSSERVNDRFVREGKILCSLSHPSIVKCFSFGVWRGRIPYLVCEYVSGESLRQVLAHGRLSWQDASAMIAQICDGLSYAHQRSIVHRDLKPENIMVDDSSHVKILDFGLAGTGSGQLRNEHDMKLTQSGALVGTINYMSPEQSSGQRADSQSDIYAVGCILYELVVGHPPHSADSPVGVLYKHVHDTPDPPGRFVDELPPGFDRVVLKALAKRRDERYKTVDDLRKDLDSILAGGAPLALCSPPAILRASNKWLFVLLAITLVIAGTLLTLNQNLQGPGDKAALPEDNTRTTDSLLPSTARFTYETIVRLRFSPGTRERRLRIAKNWLAKDSGKSDRWHTALILLQLGESESFFGGDASNIQIPVTPIAGRLHFLEALRLMADSKGTEHFHIALISLGEVEAFQLNDAKSGRERLLEALKSLSLLKRTDHWVIYNRIRALCSLGDMEINQLNDPGSAREHLLEVLKILTRSPVADVSGLLQRVSVLSNLSKAEARLKDAKSARERLLEALKLLAESKTTDVSVLHRRVDVLCELGQVEAKELNDAASARNRIDEAIELLDSEKTDPPSEVLSNLVRLETQLNNPNSKRQGLVEGLKHSTNCKDTDKWTVRCRLTALHRLAKNAKKADKPTAGEQTLQH